MITHTGEKVHKCAECGESFGQAGHLKQHMLVHSGEKPHKCTQCDYTSSRASTLKDHMKTHSLEKPTKALSANPIITERATRGRGPNAGILY